MVFTKNRHEILSKTLHQLTDVDLPVIVLDDSTNTKTRQIVDNIAKKGNNFCYHGRYTQKGLLQGLIKLGFDLDCFIKPLGTNGWTLGYARNYAIILAKALGFEQVLFIDDDIIIKDYNIIQKMMKLLSNADFVGAKIGGMPDDSVVDYIMRELDMKLHKFLSGGFLAFNLDSVSEYFLNYYNEDWIWLFLHKPKAKLIKYGEVYQLAYNPFKNAVERALQQEYGEILVDGVHEAFKRKDFSLLIHKDFWDEILEDRIIDIRNLKRQCKGKNIESSGVAVCEALLSCHSKTKSDAFTKVFVDYFDKRGKWLLILRKLHNKDSKLQIRTIVQEV